MTKDKRRTIRRPMRYCAVLALEGEVQRNCVISDVSDSGARIDVETADELPDRFTLILSGNGSPGRLCRVVWRKPSQVGVTFDGRLPKEERVALVPEVDLDNLPEPAEAEPVKVD